MDHPALPGKHWNVSVFRGSRRIHIYKLVEEIPLKNYKLQIRSQVGFKLFGSTESVAEIKFTKNVFYPGELIDIHLSCDNSQCSKDVKSYKFKLHR